MTSNQAAFDDFVDDCYILEDPLCTKNSQESLELVASQLIAELLKQEDKEILAA